MIISCPKCKAQYKLDSLIKNAILVCHRCGTEFNPNQETKPAQMRIAQGVSLFDAAQQQVNKKESPAMDTSTDIDVEQHDVVSEPTDTTETPITTYDISDDITTHLDKSMLMPKRASVRLWPWLILVLLCIAGFGVWQNQQQWLQHPWVRSAMLQMNLPIKAKDSDWLIVRDHIQQQWIDRQDKSRVLLISGYIQNRLYAKQIPPAFLVTFFDIPESGAIDTRLMSFTEPPNLPQIRHAPYIAPPKDTVPIAAKGKRAFTLVIEHVPEGTRHVSLSIATREE
jgi:hypothetical protein